MILVLLGQLSKPVVSALQLVDDGATRRSIKTGGAKLHSGAVIARFDPTYRAVHPAPQHRDGIRSPSSHDIVSNPMHRPGLIRVGDAVSK